MTTINLRGGWADLIGTLNPSPQLLTLLTCIGVGIVVLALLKALWDKRRGGGGGFTAIIWPLAIGAALAGPTIVIPILLWGADTVVNAALALINKATG